MFFDPPPVRTHCDAKLVQSPPIDVLSTEKKVTSIFAQYERKPQHILCIYVDFCICAAAHIYHTVFPIVTSFPNLSVLYWDTKIT